MSCCPRQEDAERRGAPKKGCEWLLVTHEPCRRDELVSGTGRGGKGRAGLQPRRLRAPGLGLGLAARSERSLRRCGA